MSPLTIAIVDDHTLLRDALRAFLATQKDLQLVGEAADAPSAYAMVEKTRPDVILLDVGLPGANGITATRELLRYQADRKVLLLSMTITENSVAEGMVAGAMGYVGKDQPASEIVSAIRAVGAGEIYFSPRVSRQVVESYVRQHWGEAIPLPLAELTGRERQVFKLLLTGLSNDAISAHLMIGRRTVETHRSHVMKKLQVHTIAELFRFAARHGCLPT